MKKIYLAIACSIMTLLSYSQCVVTATGTNVLCNGDCNGTATANGVGVPPLNYLWSPGGQTTASITGLCAGTYTVTMVDGSSCTSSSTVTITQPPPLAATATHTNITCNGLCNGVATAFVTGGTGSYTHKWNTIPVQTTAIADSLCVGSYYDSISDGNNCKIVLGPVSITQPLPLNAPVTCTSVSCFGGTNGSSTVNPTGGTTSYTYNWSTIPAQTTQTATNLSPGTYTVTVTDANACTATGSCTVNAPSSALAVSGTSMNATCSTCCDASASSTATGGTPGYTYMWSPGGQTTASITGICPGNYTVCVTDAGGCTSCDTISVNYTVGITESSNLTAMHVYPNPAHDNIEVQIELPGPVEITFSIINVIGKEVYLEKVAANGIYTKKFNLQTLTPGVYFLKAGVAGDSYTHKIIKY